MLVNPCDFRVPTVNQRLKKDAHTQGDNGMQAMCVLHMIQLEAKSQL